MRKEVETSKDPKEEAFQVSKIERESRIIYLNDPIDKESAYKTNRLLLLLDEINNEPIKLFINSPGGEVNSGFFIYDCIRFIRSEVYIIGAGLVASAAALIYLSVDKKYRLSLPHARYMLHQPMSGTRGVVTDLEIHAKEVEDLKKLINQIIADATGISIGKVEEDTDRDFWLNPEEAKKYGIVDKIISHKDEIKSLFPVLQKKDKGGEKSATENITRNAQKSANNNSSKNSSSQSKSTQTTRTPTTRTPTKTKESSSQDSPSKDAKTKKKTASKESNKKDKPANSKGTKKK